MIGPHPWRVAYRATHRAREPAATYPCALAGWGSYCTTNIQPALPAANVMVWDHCHRHGFIRGPLCAFHNGRMRHYDNGHERYMHEPDLIDYAWRCAACGPPW